MIDWKSKYLKYKLKYFKFKGGMNSSEKIERINDCVNVSNRINVQTTMFGDTYNFDCLNLNGINLNKEIYNFKIYYTNLENIDFNKIININDYVHIVKLFNIFNIIAGNYLSISYLMNQTQDSKNLTFNKFEGINKGQCNFFKDLIALLLLEVFNYKVLFANSIIINQNITEILNALNVGCVIQLQIPFLENYHFINILKNPDDSSYNIFSINGSDTTLLKTTFNDKDLLAYYLINVYNRDLFKDDKETYFNVYKTLTGINFKTFYEEALGYDSEFESESDESDELEEFKNDIIEGMFREDTYFCVILGNLVDDCVDEGCVGEE